MAAVDHTPVFVDRLFETRLKTPQTLRPYQLEAVTACKEAWLRRAADPDMPEGTRPVAPLLALATAGGKTTVFAQLIREVLVPATGRALLLCDTEELIYQMFDRVENQFAELGDFYGPTFAPGIGIVMNTRDDARARIVVATRQSLHPKRLAEVLKHGAFDYCIVDEAHGVSPDNTYHTILKTLRQVNPEVKIAGFTATPKRADRKALKSVFDEIAYTWSIKDGIEQGYLAPATRLRVGTQVDLSSVKQEYGDSGGDYNQKELGEILDAAQWVDLAVQAYREHLQGKRQATLAYFPFVAMSERFTAHLQALGIAAAHVDGTTPKAVRQQIVRDYASGQLAVLSNVMVYSKGFDAPRTDSILMARPTRSETLYTQILGRGLRQHPGKTDCFIVELGVADVKALVVGDLLGRMHKCPACKLESFAGLKVCPHCGADLSIVPETEEEEDLLLPGRVRTFQAALTTEIVSLFDELASAWHYDPDSVSYSASCGFDDGALLILSPTYTDMVRQRERIQAGYARLPEFAPDLQPIVHEQIAMLRREVDRAEQYTLYFAPKQGKDREGNWLPFKPVEYVRSNGDLASLMREGESEIMRRGGLSYQTRKDARWRQQVATPGQVEYLKRLKIKAPGILTSGEAATMITHAQALKQVRAWIENDTLPERSV